MFYFLFLFLLVLFFLDFLRRPPNLFAVTCFSGVAGFGGVVGFGSVTGFGGVDGLLGVAGLIGVAGLVAGLIGVDGLVDDFEFKLFGDSAEKRPPFILSNYNNNYYGNLLKCN